jgi:purine catabolism regulator
VRRSAGAATALPVTRWHDARRPGVADLLHDLRDEPALEAFVEEQLGALLADGSPRTRTLLATLEAYLASGGRKAEAARALHLERQSLYLRLRRIEELLGVSLDDEDVVLALHLAVRARRFRRGLEGTLDGTSENERRNATLRALRRQPGAGTMAP